MDQDFANNFFPFLMYAIIIGFFLVPATCAMITALRNKLMLDKQVPLPAGCKWGVFDTEIRLMVDVNHGTGNKPEWRTGLSALTHRDVNRRSFELPSEFVDTSRQGTLNMGRWMREQFINSDGFTTPIPFPVEGGSWDINYQHGSSVVGVNDFYISSTGFNDQRDVVTAMIQAHPKLVKKEQNRLAQQRKDRALDRMLTDLTPAITTRTDKDISMENVKRQYISP